MGYCRSQLVPEYKWIQHARTAAEVCMSRNNCTQGATKADMNQLWLLEAPTSLRICIPTHFTETQPLQSLTGELAVITHSRAKLKAGASVCSIRMSTAIKHRTLSKHTPPFGWLLALAAFGMKKKFKVAPQLHQTGRPLGDKQASSDVGNILVLCRFLSTGWSVPAVRPDHAVGNRAPRHDSFQRLPTHYRHHIIRRNRNLGHIRGISTWERAPAYFELGMHVLLVFVIAR